MHLLGRAVAALLLVCAAGARAQEAEPPLRLDLFPDPIEPSRRARAEEVRRARADGEAFQPSGVWLPPLYLTNAERSVEWISLLYVDVADYEDTSVTRLLAPLFLWHATPEERTLVTPLYGRQADADGDAGWLANWVWRRDRLEESDVVLPLFWSFRERDLEDGPVVRSKGAVAPLVWWSRRANGDHWLIAPPLVWQWGDARSSTLLAGPGYSYERDGDERFGVAPLWFAGRDQDGAAFDLVPPLLAYRSVDQDGWAFTSFPLVWAGRDGDATHAVAFPLFWRFEEPGETSTIAGPYYRFEDEERTRQGVFALWQSEVLRDGTYRQDTSVPLLLHRTATPTGSSTHLLGSWLSLSPDGWRGRLACLLWAGASEESRHAVLFPAAWHFADAESATTIVGPAYLHHEADESWHAGLVPLWFSGRRADGTGYDLAPPLLWRSSGPGRERLTLLPLLDYQEDATTSRLLSPLAYHRGDVDPASGDWTSTTVVLGLYWDLKDETTRTRVAFPLWWEREDLATRTSLATLFPLYWRHDAPGETTSVLLNSAWTSGAESWSFHLFPLVDLRSVRDDHLHWQLLGGLVGRESDARRARWRVLWLWTDPTAEE